MNYTEGICRRIISVIQSKFCNPISETCDIYIISPVGEGCNLDKFKIMIEKSTITATKEFDPSKMVEELERWSTYNGFCFNYYDDWNIYRVSRKIITNKPEKTRKFCIIQ